MTYTFITYNKVKVAELLAETGVDAAPLLESKTVGETAKSAALAVEAVRGRADTSAPRTRYQWVGGADGDLFQVEDTETKPVEQIKPDEEF